MTDIVLATVNARYIHASFGLRYLLANLGELRARARLEEFVADQRPLEIAERLLADEPRIIGLGVYIWNAGISTEVVALLKRIRPEVVVVVGGPEVSYETDQQEIVRLADHVITGEADLAFAALCRAILAGQSPGSKLIAAPLPDFSQLALPYEEYTDADIAHRLIYVEASRGCPFSCEFCLSSLDIPVRQVPLEPFLAALERLLERGVRHFKFVDRTFNLNLATSRRILEFFLGRMRPDLFLHFEMVPDRLPAELRELLARFPAGQVQLEVGIQTFNAEVATLISRRQNYGKLEENLRFLRAETGVHVHADLIAGLPGESVESFAAGFDRLVSLQPQEIQVGILKRLRGTPIVRHDGAWGMVYSPHPPYEVLRTRLVSFAELQRLRRFARYWDLIGNSGHFLETVPLLWSHGGPPFATFLRLSDGLHARERRQHGIALVTLVERVFAFLTGELGCPPALAAETLWRDYQRGAQRDPPPQLRPHLAEPAASVTPAALATITVGPSRQRRHRVRDSGTESNVAEPAPPSSIRQPGGEGAARSGTAGV